MWDLGQKAGNADGSWSCIILYPVNDDIRGGSPAEGLN
jgi:hypothetical protein